MQSPPHAEHDSVMASLIDLYLSIWWEIKYYMFYYQICIESWNYWPLYIVYGGETLPPAGEKRYDLCAGIWEEIQCDLMVSFPFYKEQNKSDECVWNSKQDGI